MASLQHLGGDRWRVRVHTTKGRTISRSFTANGERAAKRKAALVEAELRAEAERVARERAEREGSIAELVDGWLRVKERTSSPSTMVAYRRHAKQIKARFGGIRAVDLTGPMIDEWYSELAARPKATQQTITVAHRHLRAVLRFGYKRGELPSVATDRATPGEATRYAIAPPTADAVLAVLARLPLDKAWARCVALAATLGCRRGEILGLRWDAWAGDWITITNSVVEAKGGGVHVRPYPKGKRPRDVPVEAPAAKVLELQRAYVESSGIASPWVFPDLRADPTGQTPRRPDWLSLMWLRHRGELGADGWRLHDLRHAWATTLLGDGTPINVVQNWLGHAKASTTVDIYGHPDEVGVAAGRAALRKRLSPAESSAPLVPPALPS